MDIRALLFDMNGTLIDIETNEGLEEIYRAIGHFLTYQGIKMHRQQVRDLYFQTIEQCLEKKREKEKYPEWDAVQVWSEILKHTATDYTHSLPPRKQRHLPLILAELHRGIARKRLNLYPQVQEVLDQLHPSYQMAIVSDGQRVHTIPELRTMGLQTYFKPVVISSDYGYRKPDPRLFQKVLDKLKIQPEQALFIGNDMYRDIFGAQQVGMKTIFFSSNQGVKQHPGVQPDYIIYNFVELPRAIRFFVER